MPPTSTPVRETKTLHFRVKAVGITASDDGQEFGHIEAYGAAFNNVDEGNDRILPGAFTRTIQNSKARAKARGKNYILKMLWQHDPNEIIGGWSELSEDASGLLAKGDIALATQRGREFYALAKAGMIDEFSIIYDVMTGGAKYDKSGVRELSELRLFSIDPVTFPMNDDPHTVAVKSMDVEYKTVCGNTSGPIGPRDESWDGSAAKKWIWSKALDDDDKVKPAIAKKYFMRVDGDASLKTSYSYPFWIDDHISVGGVKAVANALAGARNADAGGDEAGMRGKVETLYGRINSKYPDDPELTPPWKDDGKSRGRTMHKKTLMEHYNEEMAQDLLEDWQDVYLSALTCAVLDALKIGDTPESDIADALDDFKTLVMDKFVPQANEVNLSQYLTDNSYSSADYTMQNGSGSYGYGWMSNRTPRAMKAGRAISATNAGKIADHVSALKAMAKAHMKAMNDVADGFAQSMQGDQTESDNPDDDQDTQVEKSFESALREVKALRA